MDDIWGYTESCDECLCDKCPEREICKRGCNYCVERFDERAPVYFCEKDETGKLYIGR